MLESDPFSFPKNKRFDVDTALSLNCQEAMLREALELPDQGFLIIARMMFENKQNELVPEPVRLLENSQKQEAIALLKEQT